MPGGVPWTKDQALSVREALGAYTTGVASQLANPELLGSLEPGQPAEFVVLSHNPFELKDQELFAMRILGTNAKARPFTKSN
jgi:predicted amidohydrolase YtcJ